MTSSVQSRDRLVVEGGAGVGVLSASAARAAFPGSCGWQSSPEHWAPGRSGLAGQLCASQLGAPRRVGGDWGDWVSSLIPHIGSSERRVILTPFSLAVSLREGAG